MKQIFEIDVGEKITASKLRYLLFYGGIEVHHNKYFDTMKVKEIEIPKGVVMKDTTGTYCFVLPEQREEAIKFLDNIIYENEKELRETEEAKLSYKEEISYGTSIPNNCRFDPLVKCPFVLSTDGDCSKCSSVRKQKKEKTKAAEKEYADMLAKSQNSASSLKAHWENSFFEKYGMDLDPYVHPTAIIDNASIGKGTKIWHFSHISDNTFIGENCTIGQNVFIGKGVKIGRGCKIQNNAFIPTGVEIESDVFIGPSVTFTNVVNPRAFISRKDEFKNTIVGHSTSIGANATILPGITIGRYAMIGAGAVVTKDVGICCVAFGNPAKVVGSISMKGDNITYFK